MLGRLKGKIRKRRKEEGEEEGGRKK